MQDPVQHSVQEQGQGRLQDGRSLEQTRSKGSRRRPLVMQPTSSIFEKPSSSGLPRLQSVSQFSSHQLTCSFTLGVGVLLGFRFGHVCFPFSL